MSATKRILGILAVVVSVFAGVMVVAGPASAASRDGVCDSGEFCYYFNSNEAGSVSDFTTSLDDYGTTQPTCYEFRGAGAGKGVCVKNNAASVWNRTGQTVRVYFNSNFAGASQDFTSAGGQGRFLDLRQQRPPERVGVQLAERLAGRRSRRGQELRLVLGTALDPEDLRRAVLRRTGRHGRPGLQAVIGPVVDVLRRRPHLVDPADAQRQHPDGALLLDDDRLQCLGGRRLDVAVRLT
jgi:hypothetical protein